VKLSNYKVSAAADEGAEMQVGNPVNGLPYELLFDEDEKSKTYGKCIGTDYSKPTTGFIKIVGRDSAIYQQRWRSWLEKLRASGRTNISYGESEEKAVEDMLTCVVGWRGLDFDDKGETPYTPENARKFLTDPNFRWLREQIEAFILDRQNFITRKGKN